MIHIKLKQAILLFLTVGTLQAHAQKATTISVNTDKIITEIQPTMWGLFFEDINFGADGGLYAELVKNRSFEFDNPLMGWKEFQSERFSVRNSSGRIMIINRGSSYSNPRFARVSVFKDKGYGLNNEGFKGMGIKQGNTYHFSVSANPIEGNPVMRLELVDPKGQVIGSASVKPEGKGWNTYTASIKATSTEAKATLQIWFDGTGVIDIDMVSLFPSDTWKNRPNGLRADLVQKLADMKPGFLRFPGGCIVEGRDLDNRYQWKKTVGKVEDREMIINRWNTEFAHRPAPDYFQSFGLGFFEYFLLSEDIGAEPLPILSCGLACQFNTAEVVPMDEIEPYIQDALDLVEFANGEVTTKWGKLRADMGHPAPFNMKYIGVGNEQWGPQYIERYKVFAKAIKEKYPDMIIISGTGPFPEGELFDYAKKELKDLDAEIIDEHYYNKPEWFFKNASRYDNYDRKGPKVFAGEYAAQSVATVSPENKNNWECALSEAAFMTGLERNAEVVHMCSYAPLFAHAEGWQWTPDLIWFDNLASYATPNYYVQKLFANYKGTHLLAATSGNEKLAGKDGLYASSVWDKNSSEVILKIVNATGKVQQTVWKVEGNKKLGKSAAIISLTGPQLTSVNEIGGPETIAPVESSTTVKSKSVALTLQPNSFTVVRIKTQ